jgi:hypothetical protein
MAVSMGRATCLYLRKSEKPEGAVWSPPNWDAPLPQEIEPPPDRGGRHGRHVAYAADPRRLRSGGSPQANLDV